MSPASVSEEGRKAEYAAATCTWRTAPSSQAPTGTGPLSPLQGKEREGNFLKEGHWYQGHRELQASGAGN